MTPVWRAESAIIHRITPNGLNYFLQAFLSKNCQIVLSYLGNSELQASKTIEAVTQEVYLKITSFLSLILFHLPIAVGISV